jgi:hypothetical protein
LCNSGGRSGVVSGERRRQLAVRVGLGEQGLGLRFEGLHGVDAARVTFIGPNSSVSI